MTTMKMQISSSRVGILCCKYMPAGSLRLVHVGKTIRNINVKFCYLVHLHYSNLKDKSLHNISLLSPIPLKRIICHIGEYTY